MEALDRYIKPLWCVAVAVAMVAGCGGKQSRKPQGSSDGTAGSQGSTGGAAGSHGSTGGQPGSTSEGGDGNVPTTPAGATETAAAVQFSVDFVEATSRYRARCDGGTAEEWKAILDGKVDVFLRSALAKGTIRYAEQAASECFASLEDGPCGVAFWEASSPCGQVFVGQVPLGGTCRLYNYDQGSTNLVNECEPEAYCQGTESSCTGRCTAPIPLGGACESDYAEPGCAPGSSCQSKSLVCVATAREGEPCFGRDYGKCAYGLYCDGATGDASGICRPQSPSDPCLSTTSSCGAGYRCPAESGETSRCVTLKLPGEPCTPGDYECSHYCTAEGTCSAQWATQGQPCGIPMAASGLSEFAFCMPGLFCAKLEDGSGICRPVVRVGERCQSNVLSSRASCTLEDASFGACNADGMCTECE